MTRRREVARLAALTALALASGLVLVGQHPASSTPPGNCPDRRTDKPFTSVPQCPQPTLPIDPVCDDDNEPADNPQGCEQEPTNPEPTVPCEDGGNVCEEPRPPAINPTVPVERLEEPVIGTAAVLDAPAAAPVQGEARFTG